MPNPFREIARTSAQKTKAQLDAELARVVPLSEDEMKKLLPKKRDKEAFAELMNIVKGATSRNKKVAKLTRDIGKYGEVIVRLLEKRL